jgi:MFS transporter, putative metabolite:H+ symporter
MSVEPAELPVTQLNIMSTEERKARLFASLDSSHFSIRHLRIYASLVSMHFFDGFDLLMMGVVLPGIIATFHITFAEAGLLASSVFGGMVVGTVALSWLGEIIGRKKALALSIVIYALFSLCGAFASSYQQLFVCRALAGIGLGAEIPLVFTYFAEFLPVRRRGQFSASSVFFWQISGVMAALTAIVVVPYFTWRGMFVIAVTPAIILAGTWFVIPESVRYLVRRERFDEAETIVRSISTVAPEDVQIGGVAKPPAHRGFGDILRGKYLRYTLALWFMNFSVAVIFFGLNIWLPSIFMKQGFNLTNSFAFTALISGAGAVGNLTNGYLLEVAGRRLTLTILFAIGSVSVFVWSFATTTPMILAFGMLTSFTAGGGIGGCIFTYMTELYPTEFRAMGTGCATGCQRAAGMFAPTLLGLLLGSDVSLSTPFLVISALFAVTAVVAFFFTVETGGKSLEQISAELGT